MRLEKIQNYLKEKGWTFRYAEEEDVGSIDFEYRGVGYHVWEFLEDEYGAESNVEHGGWQKEYWGDYQETIIRIMDQWTMD